MEQYITFDTLIEFTIMVFAILTFAHSVFSDNSGKRK
jgi:hypothetical protein